ncbi:hypothetical protein [Polyangium mundeleinium]|uniref:Uncharacterized protein n=1 Tax=Polyangium mundeleinium TaxID=2995306 RepID=A0ABT5EW51_9BACT|nr:hypothetical protein [Polyangium mundeleinium]MDC0746041.1 hypothetical protein [Polyangium mundeleinium]
MANGEGEGKKQRAPHPATVQRKTTKAQPGKRPSRPPHPATVQRKASTPGGARKERPPHPATVQRKASTPGGARKERSPHPATVARTNGSGVAQRLAAPEKTGAVTLASGSALYHATSYTGLNVLLRSGIGAGVNGRTGSVFPTSTALDAGRAGSGGPAAVLELRTTRALQGGRDAPAQPKTVARAEPAEEDTPPDFAVDRRSSRGVQCKLHPRALDALEPVAVHLRDARGAWARFTVAQYREMSGAG